MAKEKKKKALPATQEATLFSSDRQPAEYKGGRKPGLTLKSLLTLRLNVKAKMLGYDNGEALLADRLISLAIDDVYEPTGRPVPISIRLAALRETYNRLYGLPTFAAQDDGEPVIANLQWIGKIASAIAVDIDTDNG